jgi:hypothetical protein
MVTAEFLHSFVHEHNLIDPQPGHVNLPGDPHYDDHLEAAQYVVSRSKENLFVHPLVVHALLMRRLKGFKNKAGKLRKINVAVGGRVCPDYREVPLLLRDWWDRVRDTFEAQKERTEEERIAWVWNRHVEFEHIHPFEDGNGRSGRLMMLNHALLLGLEPWYVEYAKRHAYYARF